LQKKWETTDKMTGELFFIFLLPRDTKCSHFIIKLTDFFCEHYTFKLVLVWYIFNFSRSGGWLDKLLYFKAEESVWWTIHRENETQWSGETFEGVLLTQPEKETNFHFVQRSAWGTCKYFSLMWKADISFSEKQILHKCVKSIMCERLLLSYLEIAEEY
jgi:hypothetical protein